MSYRFLMPHIFKKTGLRLITQEQVQFMVNLFSRDESIRGIIEGACHPRLAWQVGDGYAIASFHVVEEYMVIDYSYEEGLIKGIPPGFDCRRKFDSIEQLVYFVEENYQINEKLAIWSSHHNGDLGFEANYAIYEPKYLVPLTLERIKRLHHPKHQLEIIFPKMSDFQHHFGLSLEETEEIWNK